MYEFNLELELTLEEAVEKIHAAVAQAKLGIVSDINVQAIAKKKANKDIPGYRILGACAPDLALQVLGNEPNAGTLLPCNIVVRENDAGKITVSFLDPEAVLGLANNDKFDHIISEARSRLDQVYTLLSQSEPANIH